MDNKSIKASPLIKQFASDIPKGNALDIGAGKGNNAIYIAKCGFNVTAVEINNDFAKEISRKAKKSNIDLEVVNTNYNDFKIKKDNYSLIATINALNFCSRKDFYRIIENISDGLVDDGICIITLFTDKDAMIERIKINANQLDDGTFTNEEKSWYFLKPDELRNLFKDKFEILFYIETIIKDKGHPGMENPHNHTVARIVARKKKRP